MHIHNKNMHVMHDGDGIKQKGMRMKRKGSKADQKMTCDVGHPVNE